MADLSGLKIAVLVTNGFEESELTEPVNALRDSGATIEILSPEGGPVQAMNHDEKSRTIESDGTIAAADPANYNGVLLPGGAFNADKLRMEEEARLFITRMDQSEKPVAVICHAPWLLVSADLVRSRRLTSYYTLQDDIRNAGGEWTDEEVVVDRNWVTSRGPRDLPAFIREFTEMLARVPQKSATER